MKNRITKQLNRLALVTVCIVAAAGATASAQTITNGFTFSVASPGNNQAVGSHFHSSTGGVFGNPAGKAEVGRYSTEETRGLSEYNLTGLSSALSAFVTFDVFRLGGLFNGVNNTPFDGVINIDAYQANNTEDISDYQAPSVGAVGSFNTTGMLVGSVFSFDITTIYNNAIANNWSSLGIRLTTPYAAVGGSNAVTFEDFRLTSNNQTSIVPLPSAAGMGLIGLLALSTRSRRR